MSEEGLKFKMINIAPIFFVLFFGATIFFPTVTQAAIERVNCCLFETSEVVGSCNAANRPDASAFSKVEKCVHSSACSPGIDSGVPTSVYNSAEDCAYSIDDACMTRPMPGCRYTLVSEVPCLSNNYPQCRTALVNAGCSQLKERESCEMDRGKQSCFWLGTSPESGTCYSRFDKSICYFMPKNFCGSSSGGTDPSTCAWNPLADNRRGTCVTTEELKFGTTYAVPSDGKQIMPDCAYRGDCRNINNLLTVPVKIITYLFSFIGSVALLMFVYGGVTMITSFGNSERAKKGGDILKAAIIGLIIAFGAYILVFYINQSIGLTDSFNVIK